jgi:hypothetical protein
MDKKYLIYFIALIIFIGCTSANHGTFVSSTYLETNNKKGNKLIGEVVGESRQTWFLYIIPIGEAPSTNNAIQDAMSKNAGTKYLTDLSIDDRTHWKVGYSVQIIRVEAKAYK